MQINIRMLEMELFNRIEYQTRYQAQLIFHFTKIHCGVLVDVGDSGTLEVDKEVFNYVLEGWFGDELWGGLEAFDLSEKDEELVVVICDPSVSGVAAVVSHYFLADVVTARIWELYVLED